MKSPKVSVPTARKRLTSAKGRERKAATKVRKAENTLTKAQSYAQYCKSARSRSKRRR